MLKINIIYLNRTSPLNCPDCSVTYKFEVIVENEYEVEYKENDYLKRV